METSKTILVGVTDIFFYTKIRDALGPKGYTLVRIRNNNPVVDTILTTQPLALILNMNDDRLAATDLLRSIKQDDRTTALPVLAFANHEEIQMWKDAQELGIHKIVSRNEFSARTLALVEELVGALEHPPA